MISAHLEAAPARRRSVAHVDARDLGATRPAAAELDECLHVVRLALEDRLDVASRQVSHVAGDAARRRPLPHGVPEPDALDATAD